jgi:hypothetical protein
MHRACFTLRACLPSPPPLPTELDLFDSVNELGYRDVLVHFEDARLSSASWAIEDGVLIIRYVDSVHNGVEWHSETGMTLSGEMRGEGTWEANDENGHHCSAAYTAQLL